MATIDELENRVRFVESEMEGEKLVTRSVHAQSVRNGAVLHSLRSEIAGLTVQSDHIVQEIVQNTAALRNHGTLLSIMQRDVTALRNDVTELRRGQEEIHVRLDRLEARLDTELGEIRSRFDRMDARLDTELGEIRSRFDRQDARFDQQDARFHKIESDISNINRNVAAILAAVAPGGPPPA